MSDRREASVIEESVWEAVRSLSKKLSEAERIATENAPYVEPDVEYLTLSTLIEVIDALKQKFPEKGDRELFEDLRASIVKLRRLVELLATGATLILFELAESERKKHEAKKDVAQNP
jgi:hypothetical protein